MVRLPLAPCARRPAGRAPAPAAPPSPSRAAILNPSRDSAPEVGPSSARLSEKPASTRSDSRQVQTRAPRVAVTVSPARSWSTTSHACCGVVLSKNSQLTIITGAKSQAALHSRCSRVILPSSVVSSLPIPR